MVQWFCLISWRLFDVWTSYLGIISHYDTTFYLKINVGHCDLYFMIHSFCLISWRLFDKNNDHHTLGLWVRWQDVWPKINVGQCDLYLMVQWFCYMYISWKLISGWTWYFGIMSQYDPTSDLKIFVGHCDLYFMIHWIWSWRLLDVRTLYFVIMIQCNVAFALKQCRSQWSIFFMVQWFCFISLIVFDGWMSYFWKIVSVIYLLPEKII